MHRVLASKMAARISPSHVLFFLSAVVAIVIYSKTPWWTVDDAYISYRYAQNLQNYGQLTWNPGESPWVEGYTGIFLPMLAYAFLSLGIPLVGGIKVLGIVAHVLSAVFLDRALHVLRVRNVVRAIVVFLLFCIPLGYMHATSGLETMFYMMGLCLLLWGLASFVTNKDRFSTLLTFVFGILAVGLCRPEGIALAFLCFVWIARESLGDNQRRITAIWVLLLGVVPLIVYWAWRSWAYGSWLPNTYYAKSYEGLLNPASFWAMSKFLGYYCGLPALAVLVIGRVRVDATHRTLIILILSFLSITAAAYLKANLWMNYGSRFFFPWMPLILFVLALFAESRMATTFKMLRWKAIGLTAIAVLQLGILVFRFHQEWAWLGYYQWIVEEELVPVGKYLKERLPQGSKVISYMDVGAVGFYSELEVVDFGRLNDRKLSREIQALPDVIEYFFSLEADAVVMSSERSDKIQYIDEAMAIVADSRFANFQKHRVWGNRVSYPYWQWLFIHRDVRSLEE